MDQPIPFEIVEQDGAKVGSNGQVRVVLQEEGRMFRRRGISGLAKRPAGEALLPHLNQLAGELLQRPDMPAEEAVGRLHALAGLIPVGEPQRHEWLVVEVDGIHVYTDGANIVVSRKDLAP